MQSLLGWDTQWHDRVGLSRQHHWRDRCPGGPTVWPRWRPEPALRLDGDDMALPVASHALARQAYRAIRAGATRPMSWARAGHFSPTLPFFPSLLPDQSNSRWSPPAAPPPRSLQIRPFGWGKVGGNVPHASPKVLLQFFPPLTMHICRY